MAKRSVSATTTQSTELFKELTTIFALEIFISDSSIHTVLPLQKFKSLFKHKVMDMKQVLIFCQFTVYLHGTHSHLRLSTQTHWNYSKLNLLTFTTVKVHAFSSFTACIPISITLVVSYLLYTYHSCF